MSAAPARRRVPAEPTRRPRATPEASARRRAAAERRRRERHFARRRRDLAQDAAAAVLVSVLLVCVTAGLGVLALLVAALAVGLAASVAVPWWLRRRRGRVPRGTRSR